MAGLRPFAASVTVSVAALLAACGSVPGTTGDGGGADGDAIAANDGRAELDGVPPPPIDATGRPRVAYLCGNSALYAHEDDGAPRLIGELAVPGGGGGNQAITDLAVDGAGLLVGVTRSSLHAIDPATATTALLGGLADSLAGLAFVPGPGGDVLYGATGDGIVYRLDLIGGMTLIGSLGGGLGLSGDLAWVPGLGLVATVINAPGSAGSTSLAIVDLATGAATVIAHTDRNNILGLAESGGGLLGVTAGGSRVWIDAATGETDVIDTLPKISWYGAGSRP